MLARVGPGLQRRWRCPWADYTPDAALLDAGCVEVLDAVERLTDVRCTTCPIAWARLPWVVLAADARAWAERGHLDLFWPDPPHVLIDAVALIDRSFARRQQREAERARRKRRARDGAPE